MALFRNFYRCARCGNEWTDVWSATCDDDCPECGARHMSPYKSEDVNDSDDGKIVSERKTVRIRELNDAFRRSFVGGTIVLTQGVNGLGDCDKRTLLAKVQAFEEFNSDNDPHGEHDFVSIEHDGITYFGKVDYYAADMQHGSQDPADSNQTVCVLTVMRADEY